MVLQAQLAASREEREAGVAKAAASMCDLQALLAGRSAELAAQREEAGRQATRAEGLERDNARLARDVVAAGGSPLQPPK